MATRAGPSNSAHNNYGIQISKNEGSLIIGKQGPSTLDECLRDLFLTDPRDDRTRISSMKGNVLRSSCDWIYQHPDYLKWHDGDESQILWIRGDPGKGKTMLLIDLVRQISEEFGDSGPVLSYFFCQNTDPNLNNATAVLRGLIYLIIDACPSVGSHLQQRHEKTGSKLFEGANAFFALSDVLSDMLKNPELSGAVLLVDAVDECHADRQQLLTFISQQSHVKWVVTSRNWPEIEEALVPAQELRLELNQQSISQAVAAYIDYKVNYLAKRKRYRQDTREQVHKHLAAKAEDTFLWVSLVCQELELTKNIDAVDVVKEIPAGLNPLYSRMMKQIEDIPRDGERQRARLILIIVAIAFRPLHLKELFMLSGLQTKSSESIGEIANVLDECGSFLTTREDTVHTIHQSANDFLLDSAFLFPEGHAPYHMQMAVKSLEALRGTLKRDLCGLQAPGFRIINMPPGVLDATISMHYSCIFWIDHLEKADKKSVSEALQEKQRVDSFMRTKYLYWLEALSLLRSMSWGVQAVSKLKLLVEENGGPQLIGLLSDAWRFILAHKTPIEIAPLQAYASALVFSPQRSLIRKLFRDEALVDVEWKNGQERDWNPCLQTLEGHEGRVTSVTLSPDDRRLISGSADGTVRVWDLATGDCLQTLRGHDKEVTSVAYCARDYVASGSHDNTVRIWDGTTGSCHKTLRGHGGRVTSVAYCADVYVASGSYDGMIKIWDMNTGAQIRTLQARGHVLSVLSLTDGQLASSSNDCKVKIWSIEIGACLHQIDDVRSGFATSSLDGKHLAVRRGGGKVQILRLSTADNAPRTLAFTRGPVSAFFAFSTDGQHLVAYSHLKELQISMLHEVGGSILESIQRIELQRLKLSAIAYSSDSRLIIADRYNHCIQILDVSRRYGSPAAQSHPEEPSTWLQFSPDGQLLACHRPLSADILEVHTSMCLTTVKLDYPLSVDLGRQVEQFFETHRSERLASGSVGEQKYHKLLSQDTRIGYSSDNAWLCKDGEDTLWLPSAYRRVAFAFSGQTMAFAFKSGLVHIIRFL